MISKVGKLNIGIVFGIFMLLISAQLWTDGMFVDGVYYASIARNLSEGIGSFWKPYFSATHDSAFYGHPPLAIGIQSLFFRLFGDKFWVESIYSLTTYIISGYILIKIWNKITGEYNLSWIPLLLWGSIPTIQWAAANNILENTVTIFALAALFSALKANDKNEFQWLAIAGLFVLAGFLSKGFTALFPLIAPLAHYLVFRKKGFLHAILRTLYILCWSMIPLIIWMYIDNQVYAFFKTYFQIQVLDSIGSRVNVTSRWHIVIRMLEELIIPLIIGLLFIGIGRSWKFSDKGDVNKYALQYFMIGLSGVLPIMVSMKQSGFYIVPAFPVLSLAMALVLIPGVKALQQQWVSRTGFYKFQQILLFILVSGNVILAFNLFGKIGRDQMFLDDWKLIQQELEPGTTIEVCLKEDDILNIRTYMSRFGKVSMENTSGGTHQYILTQKEKLIACNVNDTDVILPGTSHFDLLKRR